VHPLKWTNTFCFIYIPVYTVILKLVLDALIMYSISDHIKAGLYESKDEFILDCHCQQQNVFLII